MWVMKCFLWWPHNSRTYFLCDSVQTINSFFLMLYLGCNPLLSSYCWILLQILLKLSLFFIVLKMSWGCQFKFILFWSPIADWSTMVNFTNVCSCQIIITYTYTAIPKLDLSTMYNKSMTITSICCSQSYHQMAFPAPNDTKTGANGGNV